MTDYPLPPLVSNSLGLLFMALIVVVGLWMAFSIVGYFYRRSYNLSPMESASAKVPTPGFLRVDHQARQAQIERGRAFDKAHRPAKAMSRARLVAFVTAFVSFLSTVAFSLLNIESLEEKWRSISAWERLALMAREYPVGLTLAVILIVAASVRLFLSLRSKSATP